jgi:hypothetical protein
MNARLLSAKIYEFPLHAFHPSSYSFPELFYHLHKLDFNVLWLMGAYPKGDLSPYCIEDHSRTVFDLDEVCELGKIFNIEIMLDWVGNHTSRKCSWTTQHPDWYMYREGQISCARFKDETGWVEYHDVVQLNLASKALAEHFRQILRSFIMKGILWWRVDMACKLLRSSFNANWNINMEHEFLQLVFGSLKAEFPELVLVSEAYGKYDELTPIFDANMAKKEWRDRMLPWQRRIQEAEDYVRKWTKGKGLVPIVAIDGHDEPAAFSTEVMGPNWIDMLEITWRQPTGKLFYGGTEFLIDRGTKTRREQYPLTEPFELLSFRDLKVNSEVRDVLLDSRV